MRDDVKAVQLELAEPFEPGEVKFKPGAVSGDRALALAYIDARLVAERLDAVVGVAGWQDSYAVLADGSVKCSLALKLGGEWVCKEDVGGQSEQPDDGDKLKAAFCDALKRAAVKWGVGRYLYRVPSHWVAFDPQKRRFVHPPVLPPEFVPGGKPPPGRRAKAAPAPPKDGAELKERLEKFDARLHAARLCNAGDCIDHVMQLAAEKEWAQDVSQWTAPMIRAAMDCAKVFESNLRHPQGVGGVK